MNIQAVRTARLLGWGGVIPFIAMPVLAWSSGPDWLETLLLAYGAVIAAFMAGSLWARHILVEASTARMLLASNALALAAWPVVLMPLALGAGWLALIFAVHLVLDQPWRSHGLPGWYRRLRLALSISVLVLLVLAALIGVDSVF